MSHLLAFRDQSLAWFAAPTPAATQGQPEDMTAPTAVHEYVPFVLLFFYFNQ
jgi:hypothetical protein